MKKPMKKEKTENAGHKGDQLGVHPQLILTIGTQGEIIVRYLLDAISRFFGFVPPFIEVLALDSTPQVACGAPLLPGRCFLNCAHPVAEYILRNRENYPDLQKWLPGESHKLALGNGAGGERAVGMLFFVTALPIIAQTLTERLACFRPEACANLEAACNRDPRLLQKGIIINGDAVDIWLVTTTLGGTCAASLGLGSLVAKVLTVEGVRGTQNLILLQPEITANASASFTQRHKQVNTYAAFAETYSATVHRPFTIETMEGVLEQVSQLFQTIVTIEPATGNLETLTRQLGQDLLFHLTTSPLGPQYHRKCVDLQARVFSQEGPYHQKRIFSTAGLAVLYAVPENVEALVEHSLISSALKRILSPESPSSLAGVQLDELGVSDGKLCESQPTLALLQPRRLTVAAVDKAIIAHAPVIASELKRLLDIASHEVKGRLETGRQALYQRLVETLREHSLPAMLEQASQFIAQLEEEKQAMQAARSRVSRQDRESVAATATAEQRLDAHNRRCQLGLQRQFLAAIERDYTHLIDWFAGFIRNGRILLGDLERLLRQEENLLERELVIAAAARPHRVLDTTDILALLQDQTQALGDLAVRFLEDGMLEGKIEESQIKELRQKAAEMAAVGAKPYRSIRAALSLVPEAEQQNLLNQVYRAAQPSLRIEEDYLDYEEHVLVSLSEEDAGLLRLLRTCSKNVICSQAWADDAIVILRSWHGLEPSSMSALREARAAFARQTDLLAQGLNGERRTVFPFVDRRFDPPCLVVPPRHRRNGLMLIPLSDHFGGPIRYDPGRCHYVFQNGQQPVALGATRHQAVEALLRDENRHPGLPSLAELIAWGRASLERLAPSKAIEVLEAMIRKQEKYLKNPDLAPERLVMEEEYLALQFALEERRRGLRHQEALAQTNGNSKRDPDACEDLPS